MPLHTLNLERMQAETVAKFRKSMSGEMRAELEAERALENQEEVAAATQVSCKFTHFLTFRCQTHSFSRLNGRVFRLEGRMCTNFVCCL